MRKQHYHCKTLIGDNYVSSCAFAYKEFNTFETLVCGPDHAPIHDDEGREETDIRGHASFEDMVKFHREAVKRLEDASGLKATES